MRTAAIWAALMIGFGPRISAEDVPETAWTRVIGDSQHLEECYSVRPAGDGGFILAGRRSLPTQGAYSDIFLVKTDSAGQTVWTGAYDLGINGHTRANAVEPAADGGYIAAGWADNQSGNRDGYIVKVDASGNRLWHYLYGGGDDDVFNALALTADGGMIAAGSTASTAYGDGVGAYVVRLDADGGVIWQYYYGAEGNEYACSIKETPDRGFIFCGSTSSEDGYGIDDQAVYLVKIGSNGSVQWEKTFDYSSYGEEVAESVAVPADGGYVFAGWFESGADPGITLLVRTNSQGVVIWQKAYNWAAADKFSSVCPAPDGGFTACGRTNSFGNGNYDLMVVNTDAEGDFQWVLNFGGGDYDAGYSICPVPAGGYIAGGKVNNLGGQTGTGIYLVRLGASSLPPAGSLPWINDYDGDGVSDLAVFRPASGLWAVRGVTRAYFGGSSDQPVPGDYDGDGTTEPAVFRPASGLWAARGVTRIYFGGLADSPLPRDYNGDGTTEPAVFRPASGLWAIRGVSRIYFGSAADNPVPGYYSGAAAEPAIFRPGSGLWAVRGVTRLYFGSSGDTAVPGDYGGSGIWAPAVFRPATGLWAARGLTRAYFGAGTDTPVPGGYGDGESDRLGIFRPASGLWAIRGTSRVYFGGRGDIPVSR